MKHTRPLGETPENGQSTGETIRNRTLRRLKLALIENDRADRGYNPYDAASQRPGDVWRSKSKRA